MTTATRKQVRVLDILLAPMLWLERARGRRRTLLVVAYSIVGMIAGFFVWWITSLNNLPDVGDPFDVKAFIEASKVPESNDAFVLYRQAMTVLKISTQSGRNVGLEKAVRDGWAKTGEAIRRLLVTEKDSLELWRKATERAGGCADDLEITRSSDWHQEEQIPFLAKLALLEASRFEAAGDCSAALDWYLAVGRCCHQMRTKSTRDWRVAAMFIESYYLRGRLITWANNPKTDVGLLRRAMTEMQRLNAISPPLSPRISRLNISCNETCSLTTQNS